jgi:Mg2+ and Co2+ transporter CorA
VSPTQSERGYGFETSDEWYRFVFIDGQNCSCQDDTLKRDLLSATTYRRWAKWGTLYGISRYSLMCLTTPTAPPFIREHMRRHYRQMAELLLAQRASMIVFSSRISKLSGQIDDMNEKNNPKEFKKISNDVRKLHGDYIGFVNRLWFDEVTPQEQGIEMYDIAVKNMRLKEQMQELKAEIKELYEYIEMQDSNAMNRTMLNLTQVASYGVPFAIVLAFWGISDDFVKSIDSNKNFAFINGQGWLWVILSLLLASVLGKGIYFWATKEDK